MYDAYKDIFDFWSAQIEQHKGDLKTHKKILRVATHNMLELLALVNPELISQESIDLYTEVNYNNKDLFKAIEKNKKRFAANVGHATDYAKLSDLPPLNKNCYNVMYTTSKGDQKPGIIKYSTPYGLDPSETGKAFKIYDLATYTSANGGVTDKHMLDPKEIASYEILGMKYVKTKFTDPTAVSFSGNEEFLEEVITGKLSLYKNYIIEEGGAGSTTLGAGISLTTGNETQKPNIKPLFVIKYGKKSTVVFNYSKLADILDDCKTVSDKIKDGAYGNKQVAEKTSKLGKFVQQGTHSEISEEVILKITEEFNALM